MLFLLLPGKIFFFPVSTNYSELPFLQWKAIKVNKTRKANCGQTKKH
jgi:hypothetical protein